MPKVIWPEYISLKDWAAAIIADYPNEHLPLLLEDDKWQEWGAIVIGTGAFAKAHLPSPSTVSAGGKTQNFKDWQDWAKIVYNLLNLYEIENTNV